MRHAIRSVRTGTLAIVAAVGLAQPGRTQTTYDFEALSPGDLLGQDGWVSATFGTTALAVTTGIGTNDTQVVENSQSAVTVMARRADPGFGLPPLTGAETSVTLEVDCIADWNIGFNAFVGIAPWADLNSNSVVDGGEVGPLFGFNHNAGSGAPSFYLGDSAAGATSILAPVPTSVDPGDWLRIRLVMDLTANGGNGAGTLTFRNLTDDEPGFSATGVTGFDLRFSQGRHPTTWNGVFIRIDDGAPGTIVRPQLDRITALPEPSIASGLTGSGLALLILSRRRTRRT